MKNEKYPNDLTEGKTFTQWIIGDIPRLLTMIGLIIGGIAVLFMRLGQYNSLAVIILVKVVVGIGFPVLGIWFNYSRYIQKRKGIVS